MRYRERTRRVGLAVLLTLSGCGPVGGYVWVDDLSPSLLGSSELKGYVIESGDLLNVRVFEKNEMSTRARVRPDGKISVPLLGDILVAGRRPAELARDLEVQMKPFVVVPAITVTAEEVQPIRISVVGEVAHPGMYTPDPGSGVLAVIAMSGGMTEFADPDRIFVLRRSPGQRPIRVRFTYGGLTRGTGAGPAYSLRSGDIVVVE